jgi:DNA-binding NarL/FixJ family response regulator
MPSLKTYIVEDSPIILDGLIDALEEVTPVEVIGTAADEPSAVEWLDRRGQDCDLMIIDVFLKSGSGLGVLRCAARAALRGKRVVLTNYATDDMREACAKLGADRVFDKSRELEELIAYCANLAGGDRPTTPGAAR